MTRRPPAATWRQDVSGCAQVGCLVVGAGIGGAIAFVALLVGVNVFSGYVVTAAAGILQAPVGAFVGGCLAVVLGGWFVWRVATRWSRPDAPTYGKVLAIVIGVCLIVIGAWALVDATKRLIGA